MLLIQHPNLPSPSQMGSTFWHGTFREAEISELHVRSIQIATIVNSHTYFPLSTQFFAHCYFRTPHEITRLFPAWAAYYKFARRNREMGNRNQPKKLKRWRDVARVVHDPNLVMPALRQLYKSPKDIDIYIGGLLERPPTRVERFRQRRQRNVNGNRGRRGIRIRWRGGGQFRGLGVGRRRSKSGFIF